MKRFFGQLPFVSLHRRKLYFELKHELESQPGSARQCRYTATCCPSNFVEIRLIELANTMEAYPPSVYVGSKLECFILIAVLVVFVHANDLVLRLVFLS